MTSERLKAYQNELPQKWNTDAGSILKTASILVKAELEAKSEPLERALLKELLRELKFTPKMGQRLRKIGRDGRLYDPTVITKLPDKWGTIEQISLLSKNQFAALRESGKLRPSITRSEILRFKNGKDPEKGKDWSDTQKLLTIRLKTKDPEMAQKILDELQYIAGRLGVEFDGESILVEDHELPQKLEQRCYKDLQREFDRAYNQGLKAGKQICRFVTRQMKNRASESTKHQVLRGQTVTTWSMEENTSPKDYDSLELAFSALNIDIDVEELKRDPEVGRRYLEKLKERAL